MRASTRKLSPDGAEIRCDVATARILLPGGWPIRAEDAPQILLGTMSPLSSGRVGFAALAKLSYLTPQSSDEIAFGVKFVKMHDEHEQRLQLFLLEATEPR